MPNHHKSRNCLEKELQDEARAYEPLFWLVPEPLRIISPSDVVTKRQLIEMKIQLRRIERLANGEETGWFQDALYKVMLYAWLYIWTVLMIIFGAVLIVAMNVLWIWFLGYLLYIMFFE